MLKTVTVARATVTDDASLRSRLYSSAAAPGTRAAPRHPSPSRVFPLRILGVYWAFIKLLFITAVPNTKLCAWGEEDSGGHVL
jgi:hypothetical protein